MEYREFAPAAELKAYVRERRFLSRVEVEGPMEGQTVGEEWCWNRRP